MPSSLFGFTAYEKSVTYKSAIDYRCHRHSHTKGTTGTVDLPKLLCQH